MNNSRTFIKGWVCGIVVLLALVSFVILSRQPPHKASSPSHYGLRSGLELDYSLSFTQHVAIEAADKQSQLRGSAADLEPGTIRLNGTLRIAVLSDNSNGFTCVAAFHDQAMSGSVCSELDVTNLEREVVFNVSTKGELDSIRVPNGLPRAAVRFWQSMLPLVFLPLPEHPDQPWKHVYSEPMGKYEAEHIPIGPGVIQMQKTKYLSFSAGSQTEDFNVFNLDRLNHTQLFRFTNSIVAESRISEDIRLTVLHGLRIHGARYGSIQLMASQERDIRDLQQVVAESFGISNLSQLESSTMRYQLDELLPEPDVALVPSDLTIEEVPLKFNALPANARQQRNLLQGKLVRALRASPALAAEVVKQIDASEHNHSFRQWLLNALAHSGSRESSDALAGFIRRNDSDLNTQATLASLFVAHPTEELISAVLQRAEDGQGERTIGVQAALSVAGAFASRLRDDPAQQEAILAALRNRRSSIQDEALLGAYFTAWANSGEPEATARILECLDSRSPDSLWKSAIFSLEKLKSQDARDSLLQIVASADFSAAVHDRAVRGLANQGPDPQITSVICSAAARPVSDSATYGAMINYLQRAAVNDSGALASLQQLGASAKDEQVRKLASRALEQLLGAANGKS